MVIVVLFTTYDVIITTWGYKFVYTYKHQTEKKRTNLLL